MNMQNQQCDMVANFSDRRLWEILRQAEQQRCSAEQAMAIRAREELLARNQYSDCRSWKAPH